MKLSKLYSEKEAILIYPEKAFSVLKLKVGMENPVLFISNKNMINSVSYFNLDSIEERNYDINIVSSNSFVILYIINIKAPYFNILNNGIIIRNRVKWDEKLDKEGVETRYTFEDFHVISNKNQSCEIFCRNITVNPRT